MAKNTMDDLRNHLFATIEALQDDEAPMEIRRAQAICEVADRLIDTAKVEVKLYDLIGGRPASNFIALPEADADIPARPALMPKKVS
ncbi:MAG TPA: hypothetical protein VN950_26610 [Terriglobales bacterium]|nr:hypothetical protein [Terriglobales bacterium]